LGFEAGKVITTGAANTAVGYQALTANTTGSNNTAVGYLAADALVEGAQANTAIGSYALGAGNNDATHDNTCVGYAAGSAIQAGYKNTMIGYNTQASATGGFNQACIGEGATGQADNSVVLGNASVTAVYMAQDSGATVHCAGIKFDASGEVLGDYEEGFATAAFATGSGSITISGSGDQMSYTRIGRVVHVQGGLSVGSVSTPVGTVAITGLPFTSSNLTEGAGKSSVSIALNNMASGEVSDVIAEVPEASTQIDIYFGDATSFQTDAAQAFGASTDVRFQVTYFTG